MAIPISTTRIHKVGFRINKVGPRIDKVGPRIDKGGPRINTPCLRPGTKGLPTKEWIMATYHIAQYIITVAVSVAKDVVSDKIE